VLTRLPVNYLDRHSFEIAYLGDVQGFSLCEQV